MSRVALLAGVLTASLALTACSGGDGTDAVEPAKTVSPEAVAATATTTPTATATPSSVFASPPQTEVTLDSDFKPRWADVQFPFRDGVVGSFRFRPTGQPRASLSGHTCQNRWTKGQTYALFIKDTLTAFGLLWDRQYTLTTYADQSCREQIEEPYKFRPRELATIEEIAATPVRMSPESLPVPLSRWPPVLNEEGFPDDIAILAIQPIGYSDHQLVRVYKGPHGILAEVIRSPLRMAGYGLAASPDGSSIVTTQCGDWEQGRCLLGGRYLYQAHQDDYAPGPNYTLRINRWRHNLE